MVDYILLHGTCLSIGESGVLLLGPSGSGKSDLCLRLIDQPGYGISGALKPASLIADDQVLVTLREGRLFASSPPVITGRLEIRGLGIVELAQGKETALALAVQLVARETIERLPEKEKSRHEILGKMLPLVQIDPASASAPARIRAAIDWFARV